VKPLTAVLFAAMTSIAVSAGGREAAAPLVVCCAGDSLIRPTPVHLRALAAREGPDLDIREWAQGGLNSETYPSFFRRNKTLWRETACDAILLQLGTNDAVPILEERTNPAEFRSRITAILSEFKAFAGPAGRPPVLFLATVPRFCERPETAARNRVVEEILNPILREIAAAEGAVLVDNHAALSGRAEFYDPDCVHPNAEGEKALAENWLRALRLRFAPAKRPPGA